MSDYQNRLLRAIPGGAHTYSRGYDQYPANAPQILLGGKGAYVFDPAGNSYLDYGMALRAVNIGYAEEDINKAAIEQIQLGNNLTRPSTVELEAAELLVDLIDSVDMVKFTKNGSTAVSAAVKLARGYTGRDLVARCAQQPFFSYDDWFIGSTPITKGIPKDVLEKTKMFRYNDILSLEDLVKKYPGEIACVVLEAETIESPSDDYLLKVQSLCREHGIVFILDEMITGFRWHMKGAQHFYKLRPDLSTFGKAMANGFALSCVAGKREIMEQGSIEFEGRERLFLLSTTHGAEMSSLGAFIATMKMMERNHVVDHIWSYGQALKDLFTKKAKQYGIENSFKVRGPACSPSYVTLDNSGIDSLLLRTLFSQEMIKAGVLMPWIALCLRHGEKELQITSNALDLALPVYRRALEENDIEKYLEGPAIKPVFRKYN
jgi:glutamate-1-semialdehyde 2,1-aminomutase